MRRQTWASSDTLSSDLGGRWTQRWEVENAPVHFPCYCSQPRLVCALDKLLFRLLSVVFKLCCNTGRWRLRRRSWGVEAKVSHSEEETVIRAPHRWLNPGKHQLIEQLCTMVTKMLIEARCCRKLTEATGCCLVDIPSCRLSVFFAL